MIRKKLFYNMCTLYNANFTINSTPILVNIIIVINIWKKCINIKRLYYNRLSITYKHLNSESCMYVLQSVSIHNGHE